MKRLMTLLIPLALIGALFGTTGSAFAASSTTVVSDPDAYSCNQSGFIGFEEFADGTNLSENSIGGVQFTTTGGYTWRVGDFATGQYNGKYPNGAYTSQGTHWAWLGTSQGAGRIDFVNGPASYFSLLTSSFTPVSLDAYGADGALLETAGPGRSNTSTGTMDELKITRSARDIAYVVVHDSGNYFLVDSICTNAPGVSGGSSSPEVTFDVTIPASTKGLRVKVGALDPVTVDKISNPRIAVIADGEPTAPTLTETTHAPGANGCSAADDPIGAQTLNRTITLTPSAGGSGTIYALVEYTSTSPSGTTSTTSLEPLGPRPGALFSSPPTGGTAIPIDVCVY